MKALIIGSDPTGHEVDIQTAFVAGGGILSDIYESGLDQDLIDYATTNNYDAIIYSYEGVANYLTLANSNPDIMIFMPTNGSFAEQTQQLVVTDSEQDLQGGEYEFLDSTQSADSYSCGYVAGQLFSIASQCSCSLQEARIRANATKDEDGIIDVALAIAYSGSIALTVGNLTAVRGIDKALTITLERIIDATGYKIEVRKLRSNYQEIIETTDLVNAYTLTSYGHFKFRYMGYNGSLESEWSSWQEIKYNSFNVIVS